MFYAKSLGCAIREERNVVSFTSHCATPTH